MYPMNDSYAGTYPTKENFTASSTVNEMMSVCEIGPTECLSSLTSPAAAVL